MKITLSNSDGQRDFQSDVYYINNPSSCSLIDALHGFTGDLVKDLMSGNTSFTSHNTSTGKKWRRQSLISVPSLQWL
jgi:hypothetical protein